jgi:hypothetical protein
MAQGTPGLFGAATAYLLGLLLNAIPVFLGLLLVGQAVGWASDPLRMAAGLETGSSRPVGYASWLGLVLSLSLLCLALTAAGTLIQSPAQSRRHRAARILKRLALLMAGFTAVVFTVSVALPWLAWFYRVTLIELNELLRSGRLVGLDQASGQRFPGFRSLVTVSLLVATFAAILGLVVVFLYRRNIGRRTLALLAPAASLAMLLLPLAIGLSHGYQNPFSRNEALVATGLWAIVVVFALFVHNSQYSLHGYYRDRLSSVFCVARDEHGGVQEVFGATLSGSYAMANDRFELPEIVICAAAAAPAHAEAFGLGARSFRVGPSVCGNDRIRIETRAVEQPYGSRRSALTMASFMAISGAAVSPLMGRFTRPFLRTLFALLNIRLGVWVPRSAQLDGREQGYHRNAWQVLSDGWREPGALYVMREAFGFVFPSDEFVYVSDGGHWENLGLVELLRAGVSTAICVDCSLGGDEDGFSEALHRAVQLARVELGIDLFLDEHGGSTPGMVRMFRAALQGAPALNPAAISVIYVRPRVTPESSVDVRARREGAFPFDSTATLRYSHDRFEAYRALGVEAAREVVPLLGA